MVRFGIALVALTWLAGCTTYDEQVFSKPPTIHEQIKSTAERREKGLVPANIKVGNPYEINGVRYEPRYQPSYVAEGVASWYGPGFHGKSTASGERYNSYDFTAAHTTLPIPSLVRVTNLNNSKQIVVRVNDRGPFARGRVIDLSKASANALDVIGPGTAPVRLEYLDTETRQLWAAMDAKGAPSQQYASASQNYTQSRIDDGLIYTPQRQVEVMREAPKPLMDDEIMAQQAAVEETLAPLLAMDDAMMRDDVPATVTASASRNIAARDLDAIAPSNGHVVYDASHVAAVQVASYANRHLAEQAAYKLTDLGDAFIQEAVVRGKRYYRVKIRPPAGTGGTAGLNSLLASAKRAGFHDAIISR